MPTASNPERRGGFTFIEIMMSVLILAILAGLVIPATYNFARSPLNLAANQFVSIFQDLRFKSILSNRYLALAVNPETNEYAILRQNPDSGDWETHEEFKEPIAVSSEVRIKEINLGVKTVSKEKIHLVFEPSGLVELMTVTFYFEKEEVSVEVKDFFGSIETGEIERLQGFVL